MRYVSDAVSRRHEILQGFEGHQKDGRGLWAVHQSRCDSLWIVPWDRPTQSQENPWQHSLGCQRILLQRQKNYSAVRVLLVRKNLACIESYHIGFHHRASHRLLALACRQRSTKAKDRRTAEEVWFGGKLVKTSVRPKKNTTASEQNSPKNTLEACRSEGAEQNSWRSEKDGGRVPVRRRG